MDDLLKNLFKLAEGLDQFSDEVKKRSEGKGIRIESNFSMNNLDRRPSNFTSRVNTHRPDTTPEATPSTEPSDRNFDGIKGLDQIKEKIERMLELNLLKPELLKSIGCDLQRGILCSGPPGTGKTALIRQIARELKVNFIPLVGSEIMAKHYGEAEEKLRKIFQDARQRKPCIIFIDELDSIAHDRKDSQGDLEKRVVAQLLWLLDGQEGFDGVMLVAATNRPEALDSALRRPGRLDVEVSFPMPDIKARTAILGSYLARMPLESELDVLALAEKTPGFTGADIKSLCQMSALRALEKVHHQGANSLPEGFTIKKEDIDYALGQIIPTMLRSYAIEFPSVHWEDIGGYHEVKERLRESLVLPLTHPQLFSEAHIKAPKGVLLWGPPGTGKTLLAKALASEAGANFISVNGPELASKWVGESEKAIRELFSRARALSPCVLFFDELDTLLGRRGNDSNSSSHDNRVIGQLLTELDGIHAESQLLFVAATNRPDSLDEALTRPGRIDLSLKIDWTTSSSATTWPQCRSLRAWC